MEKQPKHRLHFGRLKEAVSARREMYADIPFGTPLSAVLESDYWIHYARDLRPMDIIEAFCEDGTWEASLRVMFVSQTDIKVEVRWKKEYDVVEEAGETDTHKIEWKGPVLQFAVIHRATGKILKDRLYPKAKAHEYLRDHIKQVE